MSKSEVKKEEKTRKPVPIESAANRPAKIPRIGYQIVQKDASSSTIVCLPFQVASSQSNTEESLNTEESSEAQKQAILKCIKIETKYSEQPDVWRQLNKVQDFSKGGIILKNSKNINAQTLSKLTRKDSYECKVPKIMNLNDSFHYEIVHHKAKQSITDPFSLSTIPNIDTLKHLSLILQAYKGLNEGFYYVKSSLGLFDIDALEIINNFHEAMTIQKEVDEELFWFSSPHEKPFSLAKYPSIQSIKKFQNILFKEDLKTVLPNYDMTTKDLASICCGRSFSTKHIKWVIKKLNEMQNETLCIYVNDDCNYADDDDDDIDVDNETKMFIKSWLEEKNRKPDSLIFVFTVINSNGIKMTGCHYALCYIDHNEKKLIYADSTGLEPHSTFLNAVREYYTIIYDDDIIGFSLSYCHDYRLNENDIHTCERGTSCALHYPMHENAFLSGFVVVIVTAIACLAKSFFQFITAVEPQELTQLDVYLSNPELYNGYLRHVFMSWIAENAIDIDYLIPVSFSSTIDAGFEEEVSVDAITLDHGEYTDCPDVQENKILENKVSFDDLENSNHDSTDSKTKSDHDSFTITDQPISDFTDLNIKMKSTESPTKGTESIPESSSDHNNQSVTIQPNASDLDCTVKEEVVETSKRESKRRSKKCPYCDFITRRTFNLKRHIDRFHKNLKKQQDLKVCESGNCICLECGHRCQRVKDFRLHLAGFHNMIFRGEVIEFNNEKEFSEWKTWLQERDLCNFLKNGGAADKNNEIISYYTCNHSGFYRPRVIDGSRPERKFGSCKIGSNCTASLRVANRGTSRIEAQVCYTHYGHSREFRGTLLSLDKKRSIELKMQDGTRDDVFKDLRKSVITRKRMSSRTQVMKTVFGIDDVMKHDDDHLSLLDWIVEWDDLGLNPLIFYKLKDIEHPVEELISEDFILIVQSEIQKKMALKFSKNGICCVSVKCSSFFITTLIVIDEFDDGFPIATCISNRMYESTIRIFFSQVQQNVGELKPIWFACDCNSQFYDIFVEVTDSSPRRLLYLSSIEKHFYTELNDIQCVTTEIGMYEILMTAVQENSEKAFEDRVCSLLQRKTKKAELFYSSLHSLLRRKHEWAFCYRPTDVDAAAEEFRNWIEKRYLGSEVNCRVDTAIFNLLCYIRRKWIDRNLKLSTERNIKDMQADLLDTHCLAENISFNDVKPLEDRDDKYRINEGNKTFTNKIRYHQNCNCLLRCTKCNICPHVHYCNCPDSLLNARICIHSHLLSLYLYGNNLRNEVEYNRNETRTESQKNVAGNEAVNSERDIEMKTSQTRECDAGVTSLKEKVMLSLFMLIQKVHSCDNYQKLKHCEDLVDKMKIDFENAKMQ